MLISHACYVFECAKNIPTCLQNTYAPIKSNIPPEFFSENLEEKKISSKNTKDVSLLARSNGKSASLLGMAREWEKGGKWLRLRISQTQQLPAIIHSTAQSCVFSREEKCTKQLQQKFTRSTWKYPFSVAGSNNLVKKIWLFLWSLLFLHVNQGSRE